MATRTVLLALADGYADSCLSVVLDVLRIANQLAAQDEERRWSSPPFAVSTASPDGRPVRAASGYSISVDRALGSRHRDDIVILPGHAWEAGHLVGPLLARRDAQLLIDAARAARARGALVCAGCSATFFLAEAGLLDGRAATTTWWLAAQFRQRYPAVDLQVDKALVASEGIATAGSSLAHVDLALWLVRRHAGAALSRLCARYLLAEERRAQAPYMVLRRMSQGDPLLERLEAFARAHLREEIDVHRLARAAGLSARTLARRLAAGSATTPAKVVQRVRAEAAARLLETTGLSLPEIARRVGYADLGALRKLVRREAGRGPRELRQKRR
jgi:transcriptional regulator GlxA family with amidase domain